MPDGTALDTVPAQVAHIARDPIDPGFDETAWIKRARRSDSAIKRTLLDQTLISGVGNIYADEALWRAGLHGQRRASSVEPVRWRALSAAIRSVLAEALAQGGTSFDALYVNVNGESGYFSRDLNVYGRAGRAVPTVRHADPAQPVHEPVELLVSALPARATLPSRRLIAGGVGHAPQPLPERKFV